MTTVYATLQQVLEFRDERSALQHQMLSVHQKPLISFTMNIAGPVKRTALSEFAFTETLRDIFAFLGIPKAQKILRTSAGCAALLVYDHAAQDLKAVAVRIEDAAPAGRLLDIDVLTASGEKLSRDIQRRCLICDGPAFPCARARRHTLLELTDRTHQLLVDFAAARIGAYAKEALLDEVRLTPKPGLVDAANNGAHLDMDLALMEKSIQALESYLQQAVRIGIEWGRSCAERLQAAGVEAEVTMLVATGGVNTHKGAIFLLGLLCAGAGAILRGAGGGLLEEATAIAAALSTPTQPTHGSVVKARYGVSGGPRTEALTGFPHARMAWQLLQKGETPHTVLLNLLHQVEDSNILWRGGPQALTFIQSEAGSLLAAPLEERWQDMERFDAVCIQRGLSPGGSADLLACGLFLHKLPFLDI